MLFFYGLRNKVTKVVPLQSSQVQCQHCHTSNINMNIVGRYAHFFWIPMFSVGKTGISHCQHCQQVLKKQQFTPQLKQAYEQTKTDTKNPMWFNIGGIIIAVLFIIPWVLSFIYMIFK